MRSGLVQASQNVFDGCGGVDLADEHGSGLAGLDRPAADPPLDRVDLVDYIDHGSLPWCWWPADVV